MSALRGKHVLVVEDEYLLAEELNEALEAAGAVVVGPFATAGEAIAALKQPVDVAVLNVRVRDGLTYPVATALRQRGIPFVFATGQEVHTEPKEWHGFAWIRKPYLPADVLSTLSRSLKAG